MNLSNSKLLTQILDLFRSLNLESINLEGCTSLFTILSSIKNLHKLTYLKLKGCTNLRDIGEMSRRIGFSNIVKHPIAIKDLLNNIFQRGFTFFKSFTSNFMVYLYLFSSWAQISQKFPMNISFLSLSGTTMEVVPTSILYLLKLHALDLHNCRRLKSLPASICNLKYLKVMYLFECSNLREFLEILEPMKYLIDLDLSGT